MNTSQTLLKKQIADAAVELYTYDRVQFTLRGISEKSGLSVAEIQQVYPGKMAALRGFYDLIPALYREAAAEIPEYHRMNYGEKIANYVYTTFDLLNEQRDFVEETFENMVLVRKDTAWHSETKALFKATLREDPVIPDVNRMVLRDFVFGIMTREYMQLVAFWLRDDSEGAEKTIALTDKLTAFGNALLYSEIIDKGFDLMKYVVGQQTWKQRFPEVRKLFDPGSWQECGSRADALWSGITDCFGENRVYGGGATVDIPIEDGPAQGEQNSAVRERATQKKQPSGKKENEDVKKKSSADKAAAGKGWSVRKGGK